MNVATIILAAGRSSRMGGKFKPLLKLNNSTFIEHIISEHLAAGVDNIIVVTGFHAEKLKPSLMQHDVTEIRNHHPECGMFSSIKTGLEQLPPVDAFFIHPVDTPLVDKTTLISIIKMFFETLPELVQPVYKNRNGHPPLVNSSLVDSILSFDADGGLRAFFRTLRDVKKHNCTDIGILRGVNTQEEYKTLLS